MNQVVTAYPGREIHVVLDNLSTHKPKRDMWLKRNKNVHFHYTSTHASWLNQIEIWFSILARKSLDGASFTSVPELIQHIDAFISDYNQTARPFVWTRSEVQVVGVSGSQNCNLELSHAHIRDEESCDSPGGQFAARRSKFPVRPNYSVCENR
jgi:hypothetical protein